jgi:hypothetical protein
MFLEDNLLDSPTRDTNQALPPPVTTFEKFLFPIIFIIQYICLLQMWTASGFDAILGLIVAGPLLFLTGLWQVVGGLMYMINSPNNKSRRLYFILAISDLILIFLFFFLGIELLGFFFVFISSHVLAWFYWYLSKKDSDLRESILLNR